MKEPGRLLMVGAVASGLSSAALGVVLLPTLWIAPGMLFGALVVVPWARLCKWSPVGSAGIGGLCVVGYVIAHLAAVATDYVAAPAGAAVGTALMLSPAVAQTVAAVRRAAWRAIVVGAIVGCVFTGFSFLPEGWWAMLLGILLWQVAVAKTVASAVPSIPENCCPACGYDLRGSPGKECPECGAERPCHW